MGVGLFYYTLVVMLLTILAGAVLFASYIVDRKRTHLTAFCCAIVYFFDVALVLRSSLKSHTGVDPPPSEAPYLINSPIESVIYGALVFATLWAIVLLYLAWDLRLLAIPVSLFILASTVVYLGISDLRLRAFWFFTMRTLSFLILVAFVTGVYTFSRSRVARRMLARQRLLYFVALPLVLAEVAWNLVFIIFRDSSTALVNFLDMATERNFIENILMLFFFYFMVARSIPLLKLHYEQPPVKQKCRDENFLHEVALMYAKNKGLSPREREVFLKILAGNTNQEIASSLYINVSTVKVHVHNILKKTDTHSRSELVSDFWHHA